MTDVKVSITVLETWMNTLRTVMKDHPESSRVWYDLYQILHSMRAVKEHQQSIEAFVAMCKE